METGIVLYNIERDGCLNGVYTNDGAEGQIYNEIARSQAGQSEPITGIYDCFYFDVGNSRNNCTLNIAESRVRGMLRFEWRNEAEDLIYQGNGFRMNEQQIAVHYIEA